MSSRTMRTAEEEQEKLRRFVDEWRSHIWEKLEQFDSNSSQAAARDVGDINEDPVHIITKPLEGLTVLDLIATDNFPFNKLLIVLAHDCHEILQLRKQASSKIYPRLVVFGLRSTSEETPLEGELQKTFAGSFKFFQDLLEFVSKLRAVLSNLVQQLEAIYSGDTTKSNRRPYAAFWNVHLRTAVHCLAEGFTLLITIDEIVAQNTSIGHSLSLFKRMLHSVRSEPSAFAMEPDQVESLDSEVSKVDNVLMGGLFQRCLQEDFYGNLEIQKLKTNRQCLDEILFCVREGLLQILARLDSLREYPYDREKLLGLIAVWVCHSWMIGDAPEKKMTKLVMELQRRAPVLHLFCNVRLVPLEFLIGHLPSWALSSAITKEARRDAGVVNTSYLAALDDVLSSHSQTLRSVLVNWLVSFDSTVSPVVQQLAIHAMLGTRFKQLTQGVCLANRLRHILRATIDIHAYLEVPINKEQLKKLRHVAEILKAVEAMFHRRSSETALGLGHMLQLAQSQILRRLSPLKAQLEADLSAMSRSTGVLMLARSLTRSGKDMDTKIMDALAAVNLAIKMAEGCSSMQSNIILRLALDVVCSSNSNVPDDVASEMMDLCSVIELVADIHNVVKLVTDCSFLYWSRDIMPACFKMLYRKTGEARHLQLVVSAFRDPVNLMITGNADLSVIESYEKEMEEAITSELVAPLCRDIETDLRLHVHSAHLKGAVNINPTKTGVRDLSWFLHLKPLRLSSKRIHIRSRVETYLIAAFYNHAAVALHNWKTYGEMRHLAELKYGLELDDIHLPGQTLEQGVDVLEIMRNIHLFVACYTYNLNTQVFIERVSNARNRKYLNTVNVRHVANSIRTHGTGIMSTTVNFAYQFLAQKFIVFSQFLFDDHIKSLLIKEHRFYKESREKGGRDYPVERAEKLNKDIRKLGLTYDGLSFLDQFRRLIAEMGNALGFVRMVRLGGLHYCSSASGFLHDLDKEMSFKEASRDAGITAGGVYAGKILDQALESQKMSLEGMDYLNILTTVFSQLRSNDNSHLKNFCLIVPTLTVNAVEAILQAKERMSKRGRDASNGMFTDDGFALGLAYVLKVLGQNKDFDSLHWFDSARHHYIAEKARIEDGLDMDGIGSGMNGLQIWSQKLASISEEEAHNMQLVMKRISSHLMELELIFFTFSGARIFFH
ncbi:hypothetical protein Mapa_005515 [Marchantia paleacea]|nr:hypothetical protein Mapa_005515 [Marchantia paleacea]